MKYCRYCSHCSYGDIPYCEIKKKTMSEEQIKRVNKCKEFEFNEIDVINGGTYKSKRLKDIDKMLVNLFNYKEVK